MPLERDSSYGNKTPLNNDETPTPGDDLPLSVQKVKYHLCQNGVYERVRSKCSTKTGHDPGPAGAEDSPIWDTMSDEEKEKSIDFWECYEVISLEEAARCGELHPDVVEAQDQYYKCLAENVDVTTHCGNVTGYTQDAGFPDDKQDTYWKCVDITREEKESKCSSETGFPL